MKTAYNAMTDILSINETIEQLKSRNADNVPDLVLCNSVSLLSEYRKVLVEAMKHTEIQFGAEKDNPYID